LSYGQQKKNLISTHRRTTQDNLSEMGADRKDLEELGVFLRINEATLQVKKVQAQKDFI